MKKKKKKTGILPLTFKPILWGLKWSAIDIQKDKQDIIVNTINEGNMRQWRWITDTYGKSIIKSVLEKRITTEFHPESRNLARVLFGVKNFQHTYARRSARTTRTAIASMHRKV